MKQVNRARGSALAALSIAVTAQLIACGSSDPSSNGTIPATNRTVSPPAVPSGPQLSPGTPAPIMAPSQPVMMPVVSGTAGAPAAPQAGAGDHPTMDPVAPPMMAQPISLYDAGSNQLTAPAPGKGAQISTKMFDIAPGQELFACYHTSIPIDGEINVAYFESVMAQGSHHFILFKNDGDAAADGTLVPAACTLGFDQRWVYSSAMPHFQTNMPKGVAMTMAARQKVVFDMHYINVTDKTLHAFVTLNVNLAEGEFQKAASLVSFNTAIRIPANGKQTVGGDCTPGANSKFFTMLTHTHRRGVLSKINRVMANGQLGEELVRTDDWEHPPTRQWDDPTFLTFAAGEKFHYSCDFVNDLPQTVTVGSSAEINEMCMAITYFFPASAAGKCN